MIHSFAQFEAHFLSWQLIWWHVAENQKYHSVRTGLDTITAVAGNLKKKKLRIRIVDSWY